MNIPSLSLVQTLPDADVLVLGLADSSGKPAVVGAPDALASAAKKRLGDSLEAVAAQLGGTPKPGSTVVLPGAGSPVVLVGLGDADVTPERIRRAAASGVKKALEIAGERTVSVAISLETPDPEVLAAAAEGALLASYRYAKPTKEAEPQASVGSIALVGPKDAADAVEAARITAEAVCTARDWVNTPANVLYPETFAESARAELKAAGCDVEILDEKALTKGGFGGILAVGGGSQRPPRLVKVTWAPRGAKGHLALVGKGMTFDSGGLNLKPAEGMYTMKCDMGGAAAVLGAMKAIARLGLKVKVTCFAPMAENMPSGSAFRPSDVLTMLSGTTVENGNSDAEGRLILADAITLAGRDNPDLIVDVATLTGACLIALGERTAGLMSNDDDTADTLLDAAESAGEPVWQLPIPEEIPEGLKSDVADIKSTGGRPGGALSAAAFLRSFVAEGTSWAHLDIAGPAWTDKPYDYVTKGGTGAGVRTLVALARSLAR